MPGLPSLRIGSVGRNLSINLIFTIVDVGCQTLTTLIVARLFGPELFGLLGLYLTGIHFVSMLADGMLSSQTRSTSATLSDQAIDSSRVAFGAATVSAAVGLALSLLLLAGAVVYTKPEDFSAIALLLITAFGAFARVARSAIETACRNLSRHDIPVRWGIPGAIILSAMLLSSAIFEAGIGVYLAIVAGFQAIMTLGITAGYLSILPYRQSRLLPSATVFYFPMLIYALPLMFRGFGSYFHIKVNTPILAIYTDDESVGNFRLAEQFLLMPQLLAVAAIMTYQPLVGEYRSRQDIDGLSRLTGKLYGSYLLLCLPISVLFLFNQPVLLFFFPEYEMASRLITAMAILPAIVVISNIASIMMVQADRGREMTVITILQGILNAGVVLLLVPHGVYAATIGTVIGLLFMSLVTIIAAHRSTGIPFRIIFPFNRK